MTIVFTDSRDLTTDILLQYVTIPDKIFRFNFDLFSDYSITITPIDFTVSDPIGRTVTEQTVQKGYYRKPILARYMPGQEEAEFEQQENWTAYRCLIQRLLCQKKMALVQPFAEKAELNKINQLRVARKFFRVMDPIFTNRPNNLKISGPTIAKSLNGGNVGEKTFYTSSVEIQNLASGSWYVQPLIPASHDVTVVFVAGDCYSFEYSRGNLPPGIIDYRSQHESWEQWSPISTPSDFQQSLSGFMNEMGLKYGRFDFLRSTGGELYFLELNPNGQFCWLDPYDRTGLLSRIAREISCL